MVAHRYRTVPRPTSAVRYEYTTRGRPDTTGRLLAGSGGLIIPASCLAPSHCSGLFDLLSLSRGLSLSSSMCSLARHTLYIRYSTVLCTVVCRIVLVPVGQEISPFVPVMHDSPTKGSLSHSQHDTPSTRSLDCADRSTVQVMAWPAALACSLLVLLVLCCTRRTTSSYSATGLLLFLISRICDAILCYCCTLYILLYPRTVTPHRGQ